jgi:hypothetical protein
LRDRGVDRTELEEMVASSPYGTTFIAPTVTVDSTLWSFLVHESDEIVQSIESSADPPGPTGGQPEARCMLVAVSSRGSEVEILGFLLKFETTPPVAYSFFMNPTGPNIKELLEDMTRQEKLLIEFFDDGYLTGMVLPNNLKNYFEDIVASLPHMSPVDDDTFDLAVDDLLCEYPDPLSMWDLPDTRREEDPEQIRFPGVTLTD